MMETKQTQENQSSELDFVLDRLTPEQMRFVVARQDFATHKEAAEYLDIPKERVYQWTHSGVPINKAVHLIALDGMATALFVRKRGLAKAMMVKMAGLESEIEGLRQKVATEIIEWEMGKATQPTDNKHDGEVAVRFIGGFDDSTPDSS